MAKGKVWKPVQRSLTWHQEAWGGEGTKSEQGIFDGGWGAFLSLCVHLRLAAGTEQRRRAARWSSLAGRQDMHQRSASLDQRE